MTNKSKSSEALLARAYALSNDEETKALYRDWANTYDETMLGGLSYLTPNKTAQLFAEAVGDKEVKILDVGSGTGLAGENLTELGYTKIDALDYSSAMLGVAAARMMNEKPVYENCIKADLNQSLELKSDTYEAIICTGLFTHAHVGPDCLPELFRVLKPNSFFATTVHKDIWVSGGFEKVVAALENQGVLKTCSKRMGKFFETDEEPQGWYILWECLK